MSLDNLLLRIIDSCYSILFDNLPNNYLKMMLILITCVIPQIFL